jgi:hypothetical protein
MALAYTEDLQGLSLEGVEQVRITEALVLAGATLAPGLVGTLQALATPISRSESEPGLL